MRLSSDKCQTISQLLKLPLEVRLGIYENLVVRGDERFLELNLGVYTTTSGVKLTTNPQLTCLSLVCKQIYTEISQTYPAHSLTLRMKPTYDWSRLVVYGPDPMIFVNSEPLEDYFRGIMQTLSSSEEHARSYLELFRDGQSGYLTSIFAQPQGAFENPHPQFGLAFVALSTFLPVNEMFRRVRKVEISETLLGRRYPYLAPLWINTVFVNLKCLNVLANHDINKYESGVNWGDIDVDFGRFMPNNEIYGYVDLAKSLAARGVVMLWTGRCAFYFKYYKPCPCTEIPDDSSDSDSSLGNRYLPQHSIEFVYTYDCQKNKITALELYSILDRCCGYESRFKMALHAAVTREGMLIDEDLIDEFMLTLLGQRYCTPLIEDAGWDRHIKCPVMDRFGPDFDYNEYGQQTQTVAPFTDSSHGDTDLDSDSNIEGSGQ